MNMSWLWIQFLVFQSLWLIAVVGGNDFIFLCLCLLLIHFVLSPNRYQDLRVLPIAAIGLGIDSTLYLLDVFEFSTFPAWLVLLWLGFILTLGHSLSWLSNLPQILLPPIGAIAGTASYLAGWRLEAVELPMGPMITALVLATAWAVLLPTLVILDKRIRRES